MVNKVLRSIAGNCLRNERFTARTENLGAISPQLPKPPSQMLKRGVFGDEDRRDQTYVKSLTPQVKLRSTLHPFGPTSSACFLRNTRGKSGPKACGKAAYSLHRGGHRLICRLRRRGASPRCAFRVDGSHQVASPGLFDQSWVDRLVGNVPPGSGEQGEVPSVLVALGGYGTLSRQTMFGGSR